MQIIANHYSLENAERTILMLSCVAGATSVTVKNTANYAVDDFLALGEIGTERSEQVKVTAITSDTVLAITATNFSHAEGESLTELRFDKVRFYMATTLAGTYNLQTTVDMDVANPSWVTVWDDVDGVSGNYYKIDFYNSVSTASTTLSDPIAGGGAERNTVGAVTDAILKEAKDREEQLTDREEILDWLNDCQDEVNSRRRKWWFLMRRATSTRTASRGYLTASDFGLTSFDGVKLGHLEYNQIDETTNTDTTYRLRFIPMEEFDYKTRDNDADASDSTKYWSWDETTDYIRIYPTPETTQTAAYYLHYYKSFDTLNSDGDTLEIPDPKMYKFYCLHLFHLKNENFPVADRYGAKFEQSVMNLVRKGIRQVGQPIGFKYVKQGIYRYYLE